MQRILSFANLQEIIMENILPSNYAAIDVPITENLFTIDNAFGKGSYHEMYFEGMHIAFGDLRWKERTLLTFDVDYETVEMHFDLNGKMLTEVAGFNHMSFGFDSRQHNIIYCPGIKGKIEFGTGVNMMEINIRPELFRKYIVGNDAFKEFVNQMDQQNPAALGQQNLLITPAMFMIINAIINCNKTGTFKRLYLESKVIELLLLQLEQFNLNTCNDFCSLKPNDIDKMHHAREIIYQRTHEPHSLRKLALEIGTNEFTLKKGFKEVFGTTVFNMLADLKMEQAKQLLMDGDKSIVEISQVVGYKNCAHFCTAFKRKFSVTPGKLKQRN